MCRLKLRNLKLEIPFSFSLNYKLSESYLLGSYVTKNEKEERREGKNREKDN